MNQLKYTFENYGDLNGLRKLINFASEDIINITSKDNTLIVELNETADPENVSEKIDKLKNRFLRDTSKLKEEVIFSHAPQKKYDISIIDNSPLVKNFGSGLISLKNEAIKLYKYFDNVFKDFAFSIGATEKSYPTLLPITAYQKTGYLKTSPQYSTLCTNIKEDIDCLEDISTQCSCSNSDLNSPEFVLSPSACFHTYLDLQDSVLNSPSIFTHNQNVFRYEGRFNWDDFGRLRDYHVREIVFFGDITYVETYKKKIEQMAQDLIVKLNLAGRSCITFDPFVVPSMQKFKIIQLQEKCKHELQLAYDDNQYLAVASFNHHGTAFTEPFNIKIYGCDNPVTGCVGFGIERWVLAFLSQYGIDVKNWPSELRD